MLEQKNKRLAILLLVLVAATVATAFWILPDDASFVVDKDLFHQTDLKSVDGVVLTSPTGTVKLALDGGRWKVNGQYAADRSMIEVLFATLQGVVPRRPVSESLNDSIAGALEKRGVEVVLQSGGQPVQKFYAGGNAGRSQAIFKRATDNTAYVMVIPGYRVYASGIFELPENGWRDKYVFGFNWRNFKSLQASFPDVRNDFTISMREDFLGVEGIQKTDTARLNTFLDEVSLLTATDYVKADSFPRMFETQAPVMALTVDDIAGRRYSLKLFGLPPGKQFVGLVNDADWAVFDAARIRTILRPKGFFAGK